MIFNRKTFLFSSSSRVCSYLVRRSEKREERERERREERGEKEEDQRGGEESDEGRE